MLAGVLGVLLAGCGGAAESGNGAGPATSSTPESGQQSPSASANGPLTDLLLVEGDADGLWGVEKDDAALGADVQRSPVDMYPVEPLFLACDPPTPVGEPILEAAERNHETTAAEGLNGQAYQTVATGDPDDVDAAYSALADAATTCIGAEGGPDVTEVDIGDLGDDGVAVRSSEDQAWYVVIDADSHLIVLAGFGFLTNGESSPELTDEEVATIAQAADARLS